MDPLLPAFAIGLAAEIGDKTQLLVVILAVRFARPLPILAGIAAAALANTLLSGYLGAAVHDLIGDRALQLFLGVSLIAAAVGGFWPQRPEDTAKDWRLGAFATSAVAFLILEFGDKTQFVVGALAARSEAPLLAAIGAAIGIVAANVPTAILGPAFARRVPLRAIRHGVAGLLLVIGTWSALGALLLL